MIFQGDTIIKFTLETILDELRKNPWLIRDALSQFVTNPYLKEKYGTKEIDNAINWLKNNRIDIYHRNRIDKEEFPCISIEFTPSTEGDIQTLSDLSPFVENFTASQINKPISYVIKPFIPIGYNITTGVLSLSTDININYVVNGMNLMDPATGNAYPIINVGNNSVSFAPGTNLTAETYGITPQYTTYRARRRWVGSQESYIVGCHVHGDMAPLLWLETLVYYGLLRYKNVLLEDEFFQNVIINRTEPVRNSAFSTVGGENVYSRFISINGRALHSWIDAPELPIEVIAFGNVGVNPPNIVPVSGSTSITLGLEVISQAAPPSFSQEEESWITVDDE